MSNEPRFGDRNRRQSDRIGSVKPSTSENLSQPAQGCICPAEANKTCFNPLCPRGGERAWLARLRGL